MDDVEEEMRWKERIEKGKRIMEGKEEEKMKGWKNKRIKGIRGDIERRKILIRMLFSKKLIIDEVEEVGMDMEIENMKVMNSMRKNN